AAEAAAIALKLGSGAVVPTLVNEGTITSSVTSDGTDTATAISIGQGASLTSLVNSGTITATATGNDANAVVIGTLTSVVNSGFIYGAIGAVDTDDDDDTSDETITGRVIAMDFSANTTGVSIVQYGASDQSATDTDGDDIYDDVDEDDDGDG
ncbi:hypothetical protein LTR94_033341, partial [Friedmanniomyces endolithicus]